MIEKLINAFIDKFLHRHEWIIKERVACYSASRRSDKPYGYEYHLQCKKCGEVKVKEL